MSIGKFILKGIGIKMKQSNQFLITSLKRWIVLICVYIILSLVFIGKFVLYEKTHFAIWGLFLVTILLLLYVGYKKVYRPWKQLEKLLCLYREGFLGDDFFENEILVNPVIDEVFHLLGENLDKSKKLNLSKKQAQYLALQNQINPHFLYNTLESIRSEALCAGVEGVASMTEALATFFRYTISNVDKLVTLEDELENIENYYMIQQYRFGNKLNMEIEYGDDISVLNFFLPKLTLQPIVENAIYHGIERKLENGHLHIYIEQTKTRLLIRVSDDGIGMDKDILEELNNKLLTHYLTNVESINEKKGGIAIVNVNNRIKLLFGEEFGIYIYSTKGAGTDVYINLPVVTEQ